MVDRGDDADFKGAFGVQFVGTIFTNARHDFWATPPPERGIDALVGACSDGRRTGVFVGVQVKCGPSYFNAKGAPVFRASAANFAYWAASRIPFMGVVVSEEAQEAHWFYLNEPTAFGQRHTARTVSNTGSQARRLDRSSADAVLAVILQTFFGADSDSRSVDPDGYLGPTPSDSTDDPEQGLTAGETWTLLLNRFTGGETAPDVRANAGYRLSWYFPAASEERKAEAKGRMRSLDDGGLAGILDCFGLMIEENASPVAELIVGMLSYCPDAAARVERLLASGAISKRARAWGSQALDQLAVDE